MLNVLTFLQGEHGFYIAMVYVAAMVIPLTIFYLWRRKKKLLET